MIRFELQIIMALLLDLLLGDPRWFPHPVRLIGAVAAAIEKRIRKLPINLSLAGILTACIVIGGTAISVYAVVQGATRLHPISGTLVSVVLLYTAFATRDLAVHGIRVRNALEHGDLPGARNAVAMMVGRDTDALDQGGIVRATVESVAENMVDGVTAPLFFACIGGPVGALTYKAISTLDSMFGYRNDRYLFFGWASARLDDIANYIPARLTGPLIAAVSLFLGRNPFKVLRLMFRDGQNHASPNSGISEAAIAGALQVQLGGPASYFGHIHTKPFLGDPLHLPIPHHITLATMILYIVTGVFGCVCLALRLLFTHFLSGVL